MNFATIVKKEAKKKLDILERQEDGESYRQANDEAKKEVGRSKAHAMDKELETPEGDIKTCIYVYVCMYTQYSDSVNFQVLTTTQRDQH